MSASATTIEDEINQANQLIQIPPQPSNATPSQLASYFSTLASNYRQAIQILNQVLSQLSGSNDTTDISNIQSEISTLQQYVEYFDALSSYYSTIAQAPTEFSGDVDTQIQEVQQAIQIYEDALSELNVSLSDPDLQSNISAIKSSTEQTIQQLQNILNALEKIKQADQLISQANQLLQQVKQPQGNMTASELARLYQNDANLMQNALKLYQQALQLLQQANSTIDVSNTIEQVQEEIQSLQSNIQQTTALSKFYAKLAGAPQAPQKGSGSVDAYIQYYTQLEGILSSALAIIAPYPALASLAQSYQSALNQVKNQLEQLIQFKQIEQEFIDPANNLLNQAKKIVAQAQSILQSQAESAYAYASTLFKEAGDLYSRALELLKQAQSRASSASLTDTAEQLKNAIEQVSSALATTSLLSAFYFIENQIATRLSEVQNAKNSPSSQQMAELYHSIVSALQGFLTSIGSFNGADSSVVSQLQSTIESQISTYKLLEDAYNVLSDMPSPPKLPNNPGLSELVSVYNTLKNYYQAVLQKLEEADVYFMKALGQNVLADKIRKFGELVSAYANASEAVSLILAHRYQEALQFLTQLERMFGTKIEIDGQEIDLPFPSLIGIAHAFILSDQLQALIQQANNSVSQGNFNNAIQILEGRALQIAETLAKLTGDDDPLQTVNNLIGLFKALWSSQRHLSDFNKYMSNANDALRGNDYGSAISFLNSALGALDPAIGALTTAIAFAKALNDNNLVQSLESQLGKLKSAMSSVTTTISRLLDIQKFMNGIKQANQLAQSGNFEGALIILGGLVGIAEALTNFIKGNNSQPQSPTPIMVVSNLKQLYQDFQQAQSIAQDMQRELQEAQQALQAVGELASTMYANALPHAQKAYEDLQKLLQLQNQINSDVTSLSSNAQPVQLVPQSVVNKVTSFYHQVKKEYEALNNGNPLSWLENAWQTVAMNVTNAVNDALNAINNFIESHIPGVVGQIISGVVDGIIFTLASVLTGGIFDIIYGLSFLSEIAFNVAVGGESLGEVFNSFKDFMLSPQGLAMLVTSFGFGAIGAKLGLFDRIEMKIPDPIKDFRAKIDPINILKGVVTKIRDFIEARIPTPKVTVGAVYATVDKVSVDAVRVDQFVSEKPFVVKVGEVEDVIKKAGSLEKSLKVLDELKKLSPEFKDYIVKVSVEDVKPILAKIDAVDRTVIVNLRQLVKVKEVTGIEKVEPESGTLVRTEEGELKAITSSGSKSVSKLTSQLVSEVQKYFGKEVSSGEYYTSPKEQNAILSQDIVVQEGGALKLTKASASFSASAKNVAGNYIEREVNITTELTPSGILAKKPLAKAIGEQLASKPFGDRLYSYIDYLRESGKLNLTEGDMKLLKAMTDAIDIPSRTNIDEALVNEVMTRFYSFKAMLADALANYFRSKGIDVSDADALLEKVLNDREFEITPEDVIYPQILFSHIVNFIVKDRLDTMGLSDAFDKLVDRIAKEYHISISDAEKIAREYLENPYMNSDELVVLVKQLLRRKAPSTQTSVETSQAKVNAGNNINVTEVKTTNVGAQQTGVDLLKVSGYDAMVKNITEKVVDLAKRLRDMGKVKLTDADLKLLKEYTEVYAKDYVESYLKKGESPQIPGDRDLLDVFTKFMKYKNELQNALMDYLVKNKYRPVNDSAFFDKLLSDTEIKPDLINPKDPGILAKYLADQAMKDPAKYGLEHFTPGKGVNTAPESASTSPKDVNISPKDVNVSPKDNGIPGNISPKDVNVRSGNMPGEGGITVTTKSGQALVLKTENQVKPETVNAVPKEENVDLTPYETMIDDIVESFVDYAKSMLEKEGTKLTDADLKLLKEYAEARAKNFVKSYLKFNETPQSPGTVTFREWLSKFKDYKAGLQEVLGYYLYEMGFKLTDLNTLFDKLLSDTEIKPDLINPKDPGILAKYLAVQVIKDPTRYGLTKIKAEQNVAPEPTNVTPEVTPKEVNVVPKSENVQAKGGGEGGTVVTTKNGQALIVETEEKVEPPLQELQLTASDILGNVEAKLGDQFKALPDEIKQGMIVKALEKLMKEGKFKGLSLDQLIDVVTNEVKGYLPEVEEALKILKQNSELLKRYGMDNYALEQVAKNPAEAVQTAEGAVKYAESLDNLTEELEKDPDALKKLGLDRLAEALKTGKWDKDALEQLYKLMNALRAKGIDAVEAIIDTSELKKELLSALYKIRTGRIKTIDEVKEVLTMIPDSVIDQFKTPDEVLIYLIEPLIKLLNKDEPIAIFEVNGVEKVGTLKVTDEGLEIQTVSPPGVSYETTEGTTSGTTGSTTTGSTTITSPPGTTTVNPPTTTTTTPPGTTTVNPPTIITGTDINEQTGTPNTTPPTPINEYGGGEGGSTGGDNGGGGNGKGNINIPPSPSIASTNRQSGNTRGYVQELFI